mgnify:CR=1 FL=1
MTQTSNATTGAADIYIQGNNGSNASVDTYSNASVHAEVIGSNSTNVGFRNAKLIQTHMPMLSP